MLEGDYSVQYNAIFLVVCSPSVPWDIYTVASHVRQRWLWTSLCNTYGPSKSALRELALQHHVYKNFGSGISPDTPQDLCRAHVWWL